MRKLLFGTIILGAAGAVMGQDAATARPVAPTAPTAPAIRALPALGGDMMVFKAMKGMPFTADESGETVRILPDGNRVTESWSGKIARHGEGSMRRETTSGNRGVNGQSIFLSGDTANNGTFVYNSGALNETAKVWAVKADAERAAANAQGSAGLGSGVRVFTTQSDETPQAVTIVRAGQLNEELRAVELAKVDAVRAITAVGAVAPVAVISGQGMSTIGPAKILAEDKFQTRKESLGTRDFSGVSAEGTRTTVTIPAGAIGNDRDIEIVSESWFSKDLGVVVYSKRTDPQMGETTYQMTNIVRAEPDPSIFHK